MKIVCTLAAKSCNQGIYLSKRRREGGREEREGKREEKERNTERHKEISWGGWIRIKNMFCFYGFFII